MSVWDSAKDNYGWLISGAAALAGYLFRRHGQTAPSETAPTLRSRLTPSRIGRWLNAIKEAEQLRAELTGLQESIARRETTWQVERAEMEAYATRIQARATELTHLVEDLRTAQAGGSSANSSPPSTNSTASDATLLPPLPRQKE